MVRSTLTVEYGGYVKITYLIFGHPKVRKGPPDDDPFLILQALCLNGGPPTTVTHRHVSFLKAHLRLSTLQPAFRHIIQ